jgi:xanthine dehydrogenase YagS FAD-binding subunit
MKPFIYESPKSRVEAEKLLGPEAAILAGGVDLLGQLKQHLVEPRRVVNIKSIPGLDKIDVKGGSVTIGACVTLSQIAEHKELRRLVPGLCQAAESVGSPQIRNMGTLGGNLAQRPRCWYYRAEEYNCLKKGGDMCYAVNGDNRYHAIFGGGPCHIVHPSDLAPMLIALGASLAIYSRQAKKRESVRELFVGPQENVLAETKLGPEEMIESVSFTASSGTRSAYYKIRERESFDWSLASCAAALELSGGVIQSARICLGGVAPVPWEIDDATSLLKGKRITEDSAKQFAAACVKAASPMSMNAYKVELIQVAIKRALFGCG